MAGSAPTRRTRDEFVAMFGDAPVRYADVLAAGLPRGRLRAALHAGVLVSAGPGLVAAAGDVPAPDPRTAHAALLRAALLRIEGAYAAGDSAALVHGLARPDPRPPAVVRLVVPEGSRFLVPGIRVSGSPLPVGQRDRVDDLPVTSLARTAVDLARGRPLPAALVPLDSAMRLLVARHVGPVPASVLRAAVTRQAYLRPARAELADVVRTMTGWRGIGSVRQALPVATAAAESPFESRSRGWVLEAGLPDPEIGVQVVCSSGASYWADFLWRDRRVVGEADGLGKYGVTAREVQARLVAEKLRQSDLEQDGWTVVRWTTRDTRETVLARLRRALSDTRAA